MLSQFPPTVSAKPHSRSGYRAAEISVFGEVVRSSAVYMDSPSSVRERTARSAIPMRGIGAQPRSASLPFGVPRKYS